MKNCLTCKKETPNPKFCSKSCAATYNNKVEPKRKLTRKCLDCNLVVENYRSTRCKLHKESYKITRSLSYKQKTLEEYRDMLSVSGKHSSWLNSHVRILNRQWNKEMTRLPCFKCGYNKHVELCHIKAVSSFSPKATLGEVNSRSNNIQLCRNCHWEFDNGLIEL